MKINPYSDKILAFAAFFPVILLMMQIIIVGLELMPHSNIRTINLIISGLVMTPALIIIINREFRLFLLTYVIILLLASLTIWFFPENAIYFKAEIFNLLFIIAPTFLCISSIKHLQDFKNVLLNISNAIFLLGTIYAVLIFIQKIPSMNYNMSYSYYLLLPALIFSSQKKIFSSIKVIIILFLMLIFGSRGPLFLALTYFILSNTVFLKSKSILFLFIALTIIFILVIDLNVMSLFAENYLDVLPRSLYLMINDQIFSDSNRFGIFASIWESILNGPILGRGLYSDRVILDGAYSHNVILEVLHNFGLFIGTFIIISLLWNTIIIFKKTNRDDRIYFLIFFFYGFLPLLFSGSYIQHTWFAVFIGGVYLFKKLNFTNTPTVK